MLDVDEEKTTETQKPPYSPVCLHPCDISHLEPCLFSCPSDKISNLLISCAVENYFIQQVTEPFFGMEITDVFETMYLAQSKDESYIPFYSRPCPKPVVFVFVFFKTTGGLNGFGRAEVALEGKWFLYFNFIF